MIPNRVRRLVEFLLPWYDPADEHRRDETTEAIRQISIHARIEAEDLVAADARISASKRIRSGYSQYANGLKR